MPLIYDADSAPSIQEIWHLALSRKVANSSEIRPIRIWLINSMPDAAFEATEKQFLKLISAESVLQIEPILLTPQNIQRKEKTQEYIDRYYTNIEKAKWEWLDGIIFTGGNFPNGKIEDFSAYAEIRDFMQWWEQNVVSILTSCFASHIAMKSRHDIERILWEQKTWWVYPHISKNPTHPLTEDMNSIILMPHSRWNDIPKEIFEKYWYDILLESESAWVGLAVSRDFRYVMFQWHPEYETASLAREYLRDKKAWEIHEPHSYITDELRNIDPFQKISNEELIKIGKLENNWNDSAKVLFARWIGLVYRLTNFDIQKQYMDGIGGNDPLWDLLKR